MARRYEVGYGECKDLSRPGATKLQRDFHIPWQLKNEEVDLTMYASSKRSMVFAAIENIVTDHT
jgi:hypothetical protein